MSKKSKRQISKANPTSSSPTPTAAPASRVTSASKSEEFNPDYSFVRKDLKRIGTLAGIFLTVLVVLSFFLR